MKIGLDIHGVITANSNFFSVFSKLALEQGHKVHIITGSMVTTARIAKLESFGIVWTHFFSITDYHKNLGTNITFSDQDNPWIEDSLWDKTKADYCEDQKIDFHIDDTSRYGIFFKTPFALYDSTNNLIKWHIRNDKQGVILLSTPEKLLEDIQRVALFF